ncbi:hypothetical protein [Segetibacter sp.]|uniref:hypothetical protein n=1 Tax=Segetibacter sp. TaxID=2231182 RepID=UPI0026199FDD|nr:hypothetical protein [Segetibacter sp.]MCW3081451.1 hypothetical protein [Segetibacter sp.]
MEKSSSFARIVYLLALIATIIGFSAFSQSAKKEQQLKENFKAPKNQEGNLDKLDLQMKQLDLQMHKLDQQMKQVDMSKMKLQLEKALQKIDKQKIVAEVNESLKTIDWEKMGDQMNDAVAQVDKVKLTEVKKEMAKVRAELQRQKFDMNFTVPDIDMKKIRRNTEKAMKSARESMKKIKVEMKGLRDFTNALESDGLIDKLKPYKIEVKGGDLYINDKKQPKEVSEKYRKYYRKDSFTINTQEEGIII